MGKKYLPILLLIIAIIGVSVLSITVLKSFVFSANSFGELFTSTAMPQITIAVYPPLGVMIENEVMARPFQKGLGDADIVYESLTEGGITRFLAVYIDGPKLIKMGPIRSARSYFVDWIEEYEAAMYTHIGGSADAIKQIKKDRVRDIDEFADESSFQRENTTKTVREHTAFTTGEKMMKLAEKKGWVSFEIEKDQRSPIANTTIKTANPIKKITINFSTKTYRVEYTYDPVSNTFLRFQAGLAHIDHGTEKHLSPKTVVIQQVIAKETGDDKGRIVIQTIGSGKSTVFMNGEAIEATWKKGASNKPTQFFDKESKPITFTNPTWIEVVPNSKKFSYE